jgi:hypothetical protein
VLAAYETGRLVNELTWYLEQAVVLGHEPHGEERWDIFAESCRIFDGLTAKGIEVAPSPAAAGRLKSSIRQCRGQWDAIWNSEEFLNDHAKSQREFKVGLALEYGSWVVDWKMPIPGRIIETAFAPVLGRVWPLLRGMRSALEREVADQCKAWLGLGECVDQAVRPPKVYAHLFHLESSLRHDCPPSFV